MKYAAVVAFVALALLVGYGFWPITSASLAIEVDEVGQNRKSAVLAQAAHTLPAAPDTPNVIILLADDLGKTDISLYGGNHVKTPNIDAIGHNGVTFAEGYCTAPLCAPSRAAMFTGRYQQRFGFETQPMRRYPRNRLEYNAFKYFIDTGDWTLLPLQPTPRKRDIARQGLPPSEIALPELFQAGGFRTGLVGKWHLGYAESFHPTRRGFDYQYGFYEAFTLYDDENDPEIVNVRHNHFANRHIWAQQRNGPCAIRRNEQVIDEDEYLTFAIAREAEDFIKRNRDEPFFLTVSFSAPHTPFQAPRAYVDRFAHEPDLNKRVYYAMIAALDDAVGRIMTTLAELDLEENTLVWFASDNGGATYTGATDNAPLKGGKFNYFEGGINVPIMAQWPRVIEPGTRFGQPVSLMDLFTTSLAAAHLPVPDDRPIDGVDLLPHVMGRNAEPPHHALFWQAGHARAVRMGDWKLIVHEKPPAQFLYDLRADKFEHTNRQAAQPQRAQHLSGEIGAWGSGMPAPLWPRVMDYRFHFDEIDIYCPL